MLIFPMSCAAIGYLKGIDVKNVVLPMSMAVLAFFMSFRAISVGADTREYVWGFQQIASTPWHNLFINKIYGVGGDMN